MSLKNRKILPTVIKISAYLCIHTHTYIHTYTHTHTRLLGLLCLRINSYILFIISSSTFSFLNVTSFVALPRNHCNQAFISAEERNYVDRLLVTSSSETDDAIQINPLVANVKIFFRLSFFFVNEGIPRFSFWLLIPKQ